MIALAILIGYIPVWREDAITRQNRSRVLELVKVGQELEKAEHRLRNAGFKLLYDQPITPTVNEDYLQQLVIVGETRPNTFETIGYVTQASWIPFTHSESPYVKINASLEGIITEVD